MFNNSLTFRSWNTNFEGDGSSNYSFYGWIQGTTLIVNPALFIKGTVPEAEMQIKLWPAGLTWNYTASLFRTFVSSGRMSTANWETITLSATGAVPNSVYYFPSSTPTYSPYMATCGDPEYVFDNFELLTYEPVMVVWAAPFGTPATRKRLEYVTSVAHGAESEVSAADKIHNALATSSGVPYEPGQGYPKAEGESWKLLDGGVCGECDEQALLMKRCMNMLGIEATNSKVYASTDGDVSIWESRSAEFEDTGFGPTDYLILYWGTAPNAFEGYCKWDRVITLFGRNA